MNIRRIIEQTLAKTGSGVNFLHLEDKYAELSDEELENIFIVFLVDLQLDLRDTKAKLDSLQGYIGSKLGYPED